jgi:glycerophosphoryl diester phosphodiesterase
VDGPIFTDVPVLCGHRGSGRGVVAGHGENTWGSFSAAADAGLAWVEVDARIGPGGALVASHDPLDGDEQDLLDVGALLDDLPAHVAVNLEIKTAVEDALRPRHETTAAAVARLAAAAGERRVLLTSFDPAALVIAHEVAPGLPRGLVTWTRYPLRKAVPAAVHLGVQVVAAEVSSFGLRGLAGTRAEHEAPRVMAFAREAGLQVAAWCPRGDEREPLVALGVDCLIVDDAVEAPAG